MKKKSLLRRLTGIIGYVVIAAVIALFVIIFISNKRGEVTFIGGYTTMWVRTGSMEPEIPEKSYILVQKAQASDVSVGDVIAFRSDDPMLEGAFNTHRVIEITGDHAEFVTKGDNNPLPDNYTAKADNILGIYRGRLSILSFFGRLFSTATGVIATVAVIFAILLLMYVPDILRAMRDSDEKSEKRNEELIDERVKQEVERLRQADAKGAQADEKK